MRQNSAYEPEVDSDLPVTDIATMNELLLRSVGRPRLVASLLSLFAGMALCLAALGIYGVVGCMVSQRSRDIGVRLALGASKRDVLLLVMKLGMTPAVVGIGAGLAGALALSRVMSSLLFDVSATDVIIYLQMSVLLAGVGLVANYLPARRAARMEPVATLRQE